MEKELKLMPEKPNLDLSNIAPKYAKMLLHLDKRRELIMSHEMPALKGLDVLAEHNFFRGQEFKDALYARANTSEEEWNRLKNGGKQGDTRKSKLDLLLEAKMENKNPSFEEISSKDQHPGFSVLKETSQLLENARVKLNRAEDQTGLFYLNEFEIAAYDLLKRIREDERGQSRLGLGW